MHLRIKDLRVDNDIKQEVLAKLLNVRQATYARYETREIKIFPSTLAELADYYNTSVDYLMRRTDEKRPYSKSKL
ncbi:MAG: helix-turn-helix transcriptional regulator [Oscillospiraceae bacterium]|nr:helix-turn-helix transcriptional regulator [Oscillospiraceae bacterium]